MLELRLENSQGAFRFIVVCGKGIFTAAAAIRV
jgi:hypothetical protein